jgi:hypothetical protein
MRRAPFPPAAKDALGKVFCSRQIPISRNLWLTPRELLSKPEGAKRI